MEISNTAINRKAFFGEHLEEYRGPKNGTVRYSLVDGQLATITAIFTHKAKGLILKDDKHQPFATVKSFDMYATGINVGMADGIIGAREQRIPLEERIAQFAAMYQSDDFVEMPEWLAWYRRFTGACLVGRKEFIVEHGLSLNSKCTPAFFFNWLIEHRALPSDLHEFAQQYVERPSLYEATDPDTAL